MVSKYSSGNVSCLLARPRPIRVRLAADLRALSRKEGDMFRDEGIVEGAAYCWRGSMGQASLRMPAATKRRWTKTRVWLVDRTFATTTERPEKETRHKQAQSYLSLFVRRSLSELREKGPPCIPVIDSELPLPRRKGPTTKTLGKPHRVGLDVLLMRD